METTIGLLTIAGAGGTDGADWVFRTGATDEAETGDGGAGGSATVAAFAGTIGCGVAVGATTEDSGLIGSGATGAAV